MSKPDDGSIALLPDELQRALHEAVTQSLGAFDSLRRTLRRHVRSERARGMTLENIDRELRSLVARAEKNAGTDGDLTTQVIRWSGAFFRSPRPADGTE